MPKLVNIEPSERVDIADFSSAVEAPNEHAKHSVENFLTNPVGTRTWIVSGFGITNPAAQQIEVAKGVAILSTKEGGQTKYGYLTAEGDATKAVDIASFGNGTYGVYLRFEYQDGDNASRIFWNAAGLGSEYAQVVATRRNPNWSIRIEASNPGSDWFKIGEVVKSGGAPVITDQRNHYFEGAIDASYANTWGAGNDRDPDRSTYGIRDLQTFTSMVRTKLEELQGSGGVHRWWDNPGFGIYDAQRSADFWKDGVASGLVTTLDSGLSATTSAGAAYAGGIRVSYAGSGSVAFTDNQDTYVDLVNTGVLVYVEVANGAAQPALTANAIRISKVIASGGSITFIMDLAYRGIYVQGTNGQRLGVSRITADALGPVFAFRKGRGTGEVPTLPNADDVLGSLAYQAFDVNGWNDVATITTAMDGTPADTDLPTRLAFWTSPIGSVTPVERMRVTQSGIVRVGNQSGFAEIVGPLVQAVGGQTPIRLYSDSVTAANRSNFLAQRSRASGAVSSGDVLGGFASGGRYGAGAAEWSAGVDGGSEVFGQAAEAWSAGARGTDLRFHTTRIGSTGSELRGALLGSGSAAFYMPLTTNSFSLYYPNTATYQFSSVATSSYLATWAMDDNGVTWDVNVTNRYIAIKNNGGYRLVASNAGVIVGNAAFQNPGPAYTINTPTFGVYDIYASLGGSSGNSKALTEQTWNSGTTQYVRQYGYRHSAGSDWTTASHYMHYQTSVTPQGFLRFGGSAVAAYGTHVGLGVGAVGNTPIFAVNATDAYLQAGALLRWNSPTTTVNTSFGTVKADGYTGKLVGGDGTNSVRYTGVVYADYTGNRTTPGAFSTITIPANTIRAGSVIKCSTGCFSTGIVTNYTAAWKINGVIFATQTMTTNPKDCVLSANLVFTADPAAAVNAYLSYQTQVDATNPTDVGGGGSVTITGINTTAPVTITFELTAFTSGGGGSLATARGTIVEIC